MSRVAGALLGLAVLWDCSNAPSYVFQHNPVASVKVTPANDTIPFTGSVALRVVPLDANGQPTIPANHPLWSTLSPGIITVDTGGNVKSIWYGPGIVQVDVDGQVAQARIFVTDPPLDSLEITPTTTLMERGDTVRYHARAFNSARLPVTTPITWSVSDTGVARVDSTGLVHGIAHGTVRVMARADTVSRSLSLAVVVPATSIRVEPDSVLAPYDDTTSFRVIPEDSAGNPLIDRPITFTALSGAEVAHFPNALQVGDTSVTVQGMTPGRAVIIAQALHRADTFSIVVPGVQFRALATSGAATCGVTVDSAAYCWGYDYNGQYGNGEAQDSGARPRLVTGRMHFASLTAGDAFFCGLTSTGSAYCWGNNYSGGLGAPVGNYAATPVAVSGGLQFSQLSASTGSVCGLVGNLAYCWGDDWGSLPTAVPGGLTFKRVFVGAGEYVFQGGIYHTLPSSCGSLLSNETTYCWTPGVAAAEFSPLAVDSAAFGNWTTDCWIASGAAYCGDPAAGDSLVARFAGTQFRTAATSYGVFCGIDLGGVTRCAGDNTNGELGNNSTSSSDSLVAVKTPIPLTDIRAGAQYFCGMGVDGRAYCWGLNTYGQGGVPGGQSILTTPQLVMNQK